ncbi:hypothetical protein LCL95_18255 [Bacillus timonensis]|nr:hypothetical protein [Bacillus timonensis]
MEILKSYPNGMWYGFLTFISYSVFFYTLWKTKDKKLIPLLFSFSGLIYIFEYVILVWLDAYSYSPHVLRDTFYDNILGSIPSNFIAVPIASIFISAFQIRWKGISIILIMFAAIELFFLKMKIYEHHWWSIAYTVFFLSIFFMICKWIYCRIEHASKAFKLFVLYLIANSLITTVDFFIVVFSNAFHFTPGWFEDPSKDHIAGSAIYYMVILSTIFTLFTPLKWRWKILALVIISLLDKLLTHFDLFVVNIKQPTIFFTLLNISIFFLLTWLWKSLERNNHHA